MTESKRPTAGNAKKQSGSKRFGRAILWTVLAAGFLAVMARRNFWHGKQS